MYSKNEILKFKTNRKVSGKLGQVYWGPMRDAIVNFNKQSIRSHPQDYQGLLNTGGKC